MEIKQVLALLNKEAKPAKKMRDKLDRWRDVYYDISLHTSGACPSFKDLSCGGREVFPTSYYGKEYQLRFDRFLMSRHPREGDELRSWRYSQYRPLTKAPFLQCIEVTMGAIFQDSNYSIEIPDKQDNDYIWGNNFNGHDLVGYVSKVGFKCIAEDPNGLSVRLPKYAWYEQEAGRVEVQVHFVNTKDIVYYDGRELIFKCEDEGYAFYLDAETIWRFTYNEDGKKYELAPDDKNGYYAHMMGKLPVTVNGGEWNTQGYYDSYFDKAKAIADDFVSSYSAAQMVDKEASHPYIVAVSEDCPTCNGKERVQYCRTCSQYQDSCLCESGTNEIELKSCGSCHGSGKASRNPGQWLVMTPKDIETTGGKGIQFVSPEISINAHHREVTKTLFEMLLKGLHLYNTDKSESGAAKAIDQDRLWKFISNISNDLFDKLLHDTISDIIAYRNVASQSGVLTPAKYPFQITKPTQFQIKTAKELLEDYKIGKEASMPAVIRMKLSDDYVDKAYSGDAEMKKKMKVVNALDPYSVNTPDELLSLRAANALTSEDIIYSQRLPIWLEEIIEEDGAEWFLNASVADIKAKVYTKKKTVKVTNELQDQAMQGLKDVGERTTA